MCLSLLGIPRLSFFLRTNLRCGQERTHHPYFPHGVTEALTIWRVWTKVALLDGGRAKTQLECSSVVQKEHDSKL